MKTEVVIAEKLAEKIENIKFLYIVIDSEGKIHYEFNNKGHRILPIHWSEMNPGRIYKNLPRNLIRKGVSDKKNIAGVLQLWIYLYTCWQIWSFAGSRGFRRVPATRIFEKTLRRDG